VTYGAFLVSLVFLVPVEIIMGILESVRRQRADQRHARCSTAIGAGLIPRACVDDARYAGVDLAARGGDREALQLGLDRMAETLMALSPEASAIAQRIAMELRDAGPEEIGRYATDVLYAYADVCRLSREVEATMYLAWELSVCPHGPMRVREKREKRDMGSRRRI
jgi:hypothetical protein